MQSAIPVDIHCGKLVEWLIQRRHCKRDWGEQLGSIRKKIRDAIKDMPPIEEIKILLTGARIDYFRCKRIVEILKTTEANTKNIFGYYSSQRMKDWQEIVNIYERDCVYLAEWCTNLIREVSYEVPNLRKNIAKLKKEQEDAERDKSTFQKQSQNFNNEFVKLAKTYGIHGDDIIAELEVQSKVLPDIYRDLVDRTKCLDSASEYYVKFAKLTCKKEEFKFMQVLSHLINKGNTTVYEYKFGQEPMSIEATVVEGARSASNSSDDIPAEDDIDFGEDIASSDSSSGFVHVVKDEAGEENDDDEICFDLDTSVQTIKTDLGTEATTLAEAKNNTDEVMPSDRIARGDNARLILDQKSTRNQYLNELYELEAFFIQRGSEIKTENKIANFSVDESTRGPQYDQSEMTQILSNIQEIISIMNNEKNKTLFQMRDSNSYVDRIVERLTNKRNQAEKSLQKAKLCDERREESILQVKELESQLRGNLERAKDIQRQVESSISRLYRDRPVNIMGGIN